MYDQKIKWHIRCFLDNEIHPQKALRSKTRYRNMLGMELQGIEFKLKFSEIMAVTPVIACIDGMWFGCGIIEHHSY